MKHNFQIEWTFGDKIIDIDTFLTPSNPNIIINIHGVYGGKNGSDNKHLNFAEKISEKNFANIILYSSSRKNLENNPDLHEFENKIAKFSGKTFVDELKDAENVINFCLENSEKIFGFPREKLNFIINGNSLGGTLAFFLARKFPQISAISSVGGALRREKWNTSILDTYPDVDEIFANLSHFQGKFILHEAGDDKIFSHENYSDFFDHADNCSEKIRIFHENVVHNFGKLNGEKSAIPYFQVTENFLKFLQK